MTLEEKSNMIKRLIPGADFSLRMDKGGVFEWRDPRPMPSDKDLDDEFLVFKSEESASKTEKADRLARIRGVNGANTVDKLRDILKDVIEHIGL